MTDPLAELRELLATPRPPGTADDPILGRLTRSHLEAPLAEITRLRGLLARLEWAGTYQDGPACPVCLAWEAAPGGHGPDCWLAKELGRDPDDEEND